MIKVYVKVIQFLAGVNQSSKLIFIRQEPIQAGVSSVRVKVTIKQTNIIGGIYV